MDKVAQYRSFVQTLLSQYAKHDVSDDRFEVQLIFDSEHDHYQWMNVGWQHFNRIYRSRDPHRYQRRQNLASAKFNRSRSGC